VQGLSLSPSTRSARADDLRKQIVTAFASGSYPGDGLIALADDRHIGYEGHRVTAFFRGKDWRDVTYPWLASYPGDPTAIPRFMRDEGFLYYLPAFLNLALDAGANEIRDAVSYALTAPGADASGGDRDRFRARMSRLSDEQRAAVIGVLRHVSEEEGPGSPAQDALESYWTAAPA
jgi:hypothetical protein